MVMMPDLNSLVGFMWFGASCLMSCYYVRKFVVFMYICNIIVGKYCV